MFDNTIVIRNTIKQKYLAKKNTNTLALQYVVHIKIYKILNLHTQIEITLAYSNHTELLHGY